MEPKLHRKTATFTYEVPDEIASKVGRLIISWAFLETTLQRSLYGLLGVSERVGRQAVKELRCRERFLLFIELAKDKAPEFEVSAVADIAKDIERLNTERDRFAHGTWSQIEGKGWCIQDTKGPRDDGHGARRAYPQMAEYPVEKLQSLSFEVEAVVAMIVQFSQRFGGLPRPPSPYSG